MLSCTFIFTCTTLRRGGYIACKFYVIKILLCFNTSLDFYCVAHYFISFFNHVTNFSSKKRNHHTDLVLYRLVRGSRVTLVPDNERRNSSIVEPGKYITTDSTKTIIVHRLLMICSHWESTKRNQK